MSQKSGDRRLVTRVLWIMISVGILWGPVMFAQPDPAGLWTFDDGSGSTATDSSGNGNPGTLTNMDTGICWVDGVLDSALTFDGVNDYVDCGSDSSLDVASGDFSVSAWVKTSSAAEQTIVAKRVGSGDYWHLRLSFGVPHLLMDDGTLAHVFANSSVNDGNWHYVCMTKSGSAITFYLDGAADGGGTIDKQVSNSDILQVGAYNGSSANYLFNGSMDEVKVFDRALILSEVVLDYENRQDLCGRWKLDEATGSTAQDSSENSNAGTLTNMDTGICWVDGVLDSALSFDGSDDYIDCGNDSSLDVAAGDFSVSAWIKTSSAAEQTIVAKRVGSGDYWHLRLSSGVPHLLMDDGTLAHAFANSSLKDGQWHYVCMAKSGSTITFYLDGAADGGGTIDKQVSNSDILQIGAYNGSGANYPFNGNIDEIKLFDKALNLYEVSLNYQDRQRLCGRWELNEGGNLTAFDISRYENHAQLKNMDTSAWVNGVVDIDGYFRLALHFDGSDDYLDCGNDSSLDVATGDFSVSAWIKTSSAAEQTIVAKRVGSGDYWHLRLSFGVPHLLMNDGTLAHAYGNSSVNDGDWHYLCMVKSGSSITFYIDGAADGGGTIDKQISNSDILQVGAYNGTGANYPFNGDIDNVKIYNIALDPSEIELPNFNLLSACPDRTYYTTESSAQILCDLLMPASELTGCYLVVKDGSTTLGTNSTPEDGTNVTFTTSTLSAGGNTVTVELRRDTGERILFCDLEVIKLASKAGFENKVDRKNGILLRDSSSFFPIGLYMGGVASGDTDVFNAVASAGFNSIIRMGSNISPTDITAYLENAADYGLLVVDKHEAYTSLDKSSETFYNDYLAVRDDILDAVGYAKLQENLLGYYSFDEPQGNQLTAGYDLYTQTNTEDAYHPTFTLYSSVIPAGDDYTGWCDIIGIDPYWYPPQAAGDLRSSVNWVSKCVALARDRGRLDHKALWIVLMSERYSYCHKRIITAAEQRCQTYIALINGAKGVFYYFYPVLHDDSWNVLSDLCGEMADLSPSLLTADLEQQINYAKYDDAAADYLPITFDPGNEQFSDVQVCLRKAPAGAGYDYVLLAVNTCEYSVDVDYSVSLLGGSGTVSRLFDAATYTVSGGVFGDTLAPHATRAYTFSSTSAADVTINVDMIAGPAPAAESVYPKSGRDGKTNLMPNPTMENAVVDKWPDYYRPGYAAPRINAVNQAWGLETITDSTGLPAGHGGKCLQVKGEGNNFHFYFIPEAADRDQDYTFSVYLKADKANCKVKLGYTGETAEEHTITTSWARYSYTVTVPDDVSDYARFVVQLSDDADGGVLRADAVQVEAASSAGTFTTN